MTKLRYGFFALLVLLVYVPSAAADVRLVRAQAAGNSIADVAAMVTQSVVNISAKKITRAARTPYRSDPFFNDPNSPFNRGKNATRYASSLGSGVIVSARGYVLTNNHVVSNASQIAVTLPNGRAFTARIVGTDPKSDLAVLQLQGDLRGLRPIRIGNSSRMRLGDIVLAIGNPFGAGQAVTMGIVSAKGRGMGIAAYEDFIQTDAAINPGNSGGALVNMNGELIGINTAILSRTGGYQGIGFAIPTNMARPIMKSLINKGRVDRGYLGVSIDDMTRQQARELGLANRGVLVRNVGRGSPAARSGVRIYDVITAVAGQRVKSVKSLRNKIASMAPGSQVRLTLVRNGRPRQVNVRLGKLP